MTYQRLANSFCKVYHPEHCEGPNTVMIDGLWMFDAFSRASTQKTLKCSWDRLPADPYRPQDRQRRYSYFWLENGNLSEAQSGPYVQAEDVNRLVGGVQRAFEPIEPEVIDDPLIRQIIDFDIRVCIPPWLLTSTTWKIDLHQIRILATNKMPGEPVPEGRHQDGLDHSIIHLMGRENVNGGDSKIHYLLDKSHPHTIDEQAYICFKLAKPLDTLVVNDRTAYHDTSPIHVLPGYRAGHRDTLLVGLTQIIQPV